MNKNTIRMIPLTAGECPIKKGEFLGAKVSTKHYVLGRAYNTSGGWGRWDCNTQKYVYDKGFTPVDGDDLPDIIGMSESEIFSEIEKMVETADEAFVVAIDSGSEELSLLEVGYRDRYVQGCATVSSWCPAVFPDKNGKCPPLMLWHEGAYNVAENANIAHMEKCQGWHKWHDLCAMYRKPRYDFHCGKYTR